ncbi:SIS domain-containing protein [Rhodoferax aquaticus]|uniref:SIS domain-containing protein n=1 Tax=Rhodoferax aquaticus TaxID=2527691 RepID=A0A515ELZ3_9BURK|nr:SIS domain-containing protein [Rhodoferax aquaticus]QDL53683.1 SIS domain-containing protein [Rhodoferax aquaticus]
MNRTSTPSADSSQNDSQFDPLAAMQQWHTYREIHAQPRVWSAWAAQLAQQLPALQGWLKDADYAAVWFCGAGTSAFIGEALASYLNPRSATPRYRAVATTDVVAQPYHALQTAGKLLVVSFGRSGNSSESLGTLDALDALAPHADRLHITCNATGALALRSVPGPGVLRTVVLPAETDDAGFAMTSSYTTMLLTALACFDAQPPLPVQQLLPALAQAAQALLDGMPAWAEKNAHTRPSRAVFLGSGPLLAAARESALKVLELTAGEVATLWDSTLGFRHGPKAFVNANTRVHVLVSSDPHTQRYDLDVVHEIRRQFGPSAVCTIGPDQAQCDVVVPVVGNDGWSVVLYVLFAQYMAMHWSHAMGLQVDNPFTSGNLTRVVSGVTLYPVHAV